MQQSLVIAAETQVSVQGIELLLILGLLGEKVRQLLSKVVVGIDSCGRVVLEKVVDIVLILLFNPILLQSLRFLLYVIHSLIKGLLWSHLGEP